VKTGKMTRDLKSVGTFSGLYAYLNGDLKSLLHVISSDKGVSAEFKRRITDGRYMRERYIDEDLTYMAEHDYEMEKIIDYLEKYVYPDQMLFFQFMDEIVKGDLLEMVKGKYF
jgi:hypothetical protein